jgi:hypothetical protein
MQEIIFLKNLNLDIVSRNYFNATLAYIRHFIFAGCYDNDPWYLVTNLPGHLDFAGHLELAGFYFSKCPTNSKPPAFSSLIDLDFFLSP